MKYKIQYLSIGKLNTNPNNPRLIRDANFKSLVKSLKDCPELFDARPCICSDRTGELVVLGGNMRLLAARELGYKEVPAIVMPGLTEEQEREILIKDNGTTWGEWDMDVLSGFSDLPLVDWGVDLPKNWLSGESEGDSGGIMDLEIQYQILVDCKSEDHQKILLNKLQEEGESCRPLML